MQAENVHVIGSLFYAGVTCPDSPQVPETGWHPVVGHQPPAAAGGDSFFSFTSLNGVMKSCLIRSSGGRQKPPYGLESLQVNQQCYLGRGCSRNAWRPLALIVRESKCVTLVTVNVLLGGYRALSGLFWSGITMAVV